MSSLKTIHMETVTYQLSTVIDWISSMGYDRGWGWFCDSQIHRSQTRGGEAWLATSMVLAHNLEVCMEFFEKRIWAQDKLGRCPLSGKSSMCMMCLKYRTILLIVVKNPWVHLLTYFWLLVAARYPAGSLTEPLRPVAGLLATFSGFDISDHRLAALHLPFCHLAINLP